MVGRVVVTAGAVLVAIGGQSVPLPGIDQEAFAARTLGMAGPMSVLAFGLVPAVSAFVLVELVAWLVPRWRRLRAEEGDGRQRLATAAWRLTVLLAFVQACFVMRFLASSGMLTSEVLAPVVAIASLTAGACALLLLSRAVSRWGLGNGFSVLLVAWSAPEVYGTVRALPREVEGRALAPTAVVPVVAAALAWLVLNYWILRAHERRSSGATSEQAARAVPLPAAGTAPFAISAFLLGLPAGLAQLQIQNWETPAPGSPAYIVANLVLLASIGALLTALWHRPLDRAVRRAAVVSAGYLVVGGLLDAFAWQRLEGLVPFTAAGLALGVAVAIDLTSEWKAVRTHGALVTVLRSHRPAFAAVAVRRIEEAGIVVVARGARHRTLLQAFGPYVEIEIMVPRASADVARAVLGGHRAAA